MLSGYRLVVLFVIFYLVHTVCLTSNAVAAAPEVTTAAR